MKRLAASALLLMSACVQAPPAAPPPPDLPGKVVKYTCAGNAHLTITYGQGKLTLPGNETLLAEDGNPNRYSWPSDGTHHVWEMAGGLGTLSLHDGTTGTDKVEKSACKADAVAG